MQEDQAQEDDEDDRQFRTESEALRDLLRQAPTLQETMTHAQRQEGQQDAAVTGLLRQSLLRTNQEEHPESPARQRPRRQTFPYPTPQDRHQTSVGLYMQHVADTLSPTDCMVSLEGRGKMAKTALLGHRGLPRVKDCRRRVTVDWDSGLVLEDVDTTKLARKTAENLQRRWPSHVSHTETFMIYEKHDFNPNWTGAQVTVKDTLQKEINIWNLPQEQLDMFTKQASRGRMKEWNAVKESGAIQVLTGRAAKDIRDTLSHRIVPSRWLDKWKVSGPAANHGFTLQQQNWVDPRVEAKSRWIVQGFHDPDIDMIERSVPTPATGDVPMALQLMASHHMRAWTADCKSAFMQSLTQTKEKATAVALERGRLDEDPATPHMKLLASEVC
eukprot:5170719-Amphidinium_carterae.2